MNQDQIYKALSSSLRRRIIEELQCQPRYVTELAGLINVSQPTVSRQLKPLQDAGIIYRKDDAGPKDVGEYHIFALQPEARKIGKAIEIIAQISA